MAVKKRFSILPLFCIVLMDMIGIGIILPILGPLFLDPSKGIMPEHISFSARTVILGFLIAAYPMAQFFGAPLLGGLSDRHGRKKVLLISLFGTILGYLLFGYGILIGNINILFISRLLDGLIGMAFGIGFIFGPLLGGKLTDSNLVGWFNYATPLWFAALLSLANIILLLLVFRETLSARIESKLSLLTGFRNISRAFQLSNLRTMFIVIFILALGFIFFTQFFQVFLIDKFHYTDSGIGNLFAYIGLWIAITQGGITRAVSLKFSPKQVVAFSTLLLSFALIMILAPTNSAYLYAVLPFVAIAQGLTYPNSTAIISNLADKSSQGEVMGISQSMQALAQSVTPVIAGFITLWHLNLPIIISSILTFIGWLVFVLFFRKKKEVFVEV